MFLWGGLQSVLVRWGKTGSFVVFYPGVFYDKADGI